MTTDNSILTTLFKAISTTEVLSVIDGAVFKGEKPLNQTSQDIVINMLDNRSVANDNLKSGVVNINCFCKELSNHTRNSTKLDEITQAVFLALNIVNGSGNINNLIYEFVSQKTFKDIDDPVMFYSNIRLNFNIKTNET